MYEAGVFWWVRPKGPIPWLSFTYSLTHLFYVLSLRRVQSPSDARPFFMESAWICQNKLDKIGRKFGDDEIAEIWSDRQRDQYISRKCICRLSLFCLGCLEKRKIPKMGFSRNSYPNPVARISFQKNFILGAIKSAAGRISTKWKSR